MTYPSYSNTDIYLFTERTREISKNPYQLFTAFVISELRELLQQDPEDDHNPFIWGKTIPVLLFDKFFEGLIADFMEAIQQNLTIEIDGRPYSIRNSKIIEEQKLRDSFQFPSSDGVYAICMIGVKNVEGNGADYQEQRKALKDDSAYLRKIIYVAYDDEHDGWDKLTDIEIAAYVWAFFMAKVLRAEKRVNDKYIAQWYQECIKYVDMPLKEIKSVWSDRIKVAEIADSICVFSAEKMRNWNKENDQESIIDTIDDEVADNYWYNEATQKDFA